MKNILQLFAIVYFINMGSGIFGQSENINSSQKVDPILFSGKEYRFAGPTRGGRVTAVEGIPEKPHTFFMGATGGGVWKTEDAGTTWNNISDGQIQAGSIGSIAVAPSNLSVIYAGTGEACPRGNVSPGLGIYKSIDGGQNWIQSGLENTGQIGEIVIHPEDPDLVYVAALGQIFGKNPERGVFRSKDGGQSWEHILALNDSTGSVEIAMHPDNPRILYTAMWQVERKPWTLVDGGPDGGIWKSVNGGDEWKKLSKGLPNGLIGRIGLAIAPSNPNRIFAIIRAEDPKSGLYRSDNSGESWNKICSDNKLTQRAWYYNHVSVDPKDQNTVYIDNVRLHKSVDGGKNFEAQIRTPHSDHHGIWINPYHPEIMINGNDGGASITLNGGETWSSQLNQPTAQFYRLTVDNQFPYRIYAGQQDNTTISIKSNHSRQLTSFEDWMGVGGGESGDVGVNHFDSNVIWAGTYSGEITYFNRATGEMRQTTAYPHYTEGTEMRDLKYRWQWNFPIVTSVHEPNVVYHASNYVHKTTDNGYTWKIISPDLTRDIDRYLGIPGGPIQHDATGVEVYCSIFALEESPHDPMELWAGSDDGLLHITRDGGQSWQDITPPGFPEEITVNKIELSVSRTGRAIVVGINYRYNDFRPFISLTNDYGKSWVSLTNGKNGIPENHFVRTVAEHPVMEDLIFAGTEFGIFVSFNGGGDWQSLQLNLPHVPVTDMEIVQGDLVLSTQGRAFWILDDIACLGEMPMLDPESNHFFAPANAIRTDNYGYNARFEFYLSDSIHEDSLLEIEIFDSKDDLIRKLSTQAKNTLDKIEVCKGYNLVQWDLRHDGPFLVKDLVTMVLRNPSVGPLAVPGNYRARISYENWDGEHQFSIKPDPNLDPLPASDYRAQFELAVAIREIISDVQHMVKEIRSVRGQINKLSSSATNSEYSESVEALSKGLILKLDTLESRIIQNKSKASQDNINYPRVFSNHIGRLYSVVIDCHHRPTAGSQERFEDLKTVYEGIKIEFGYLIGEELKKLNAKVADLKLPALQIPKPE